MNEAPSSTRADVSRRRPAGGRWRRRLLLALVVPGAIVTWHAGYRLTAKSRAADLTRVATTPPATVGDGSLRVLTYNIANGRGLASRNREGGTPEERERRLLDIAALLGAMRADVVVLNEVDFDAPWSGGVDQADFLARNAGYPYLARQRNLDVRLPFLTIRSGNAVLSTYPITSALLLDLPTASSIEWFAAGKKMALATSIELDDGRTTTLIAVHFDHRSEAIRVETAKRILAECRATAAPLIVAGDVNSHHPDSPHAPFDEAGRNAIATLTESGCLRADFHTTPASAPFTAPSWAPARTLDWVFVNEAYEITDVRIRDDLLSDHLPALSVLTFNTPP